MMITPTSIMNTAASGPNPTPALAALWQPGDAEPVFAEPWQAQTFAMTLALYQCGVFSWAEWAAQLSRQISAAQAAGDADRGNTCYRHWLAALAALVTAKGLSSNDELARYEHGWEHAALRTPHGQPIELLPADLPPAA